MHFQLLLLVFWELLVWLADVNWFDMDVGVRFVEFVCEGLKYVAIWWRIDAVPQCNFNLFAVFLWAFTAA